MKRLLFAYFLIVGTSVSGQQLMNLYNMRLIPQVIYTNPAMTPLGRVNVSIPAIGNIYLQTRKSDFILDEVFLIQSDNTIKMDVQKFIDGLEPVNEIDVAINLDIIHVGFVSGRNYISFNVTDRLVLTHVFPKEEAMLIADVAKNLLPAFPISMKDVKVDFIHFREFAIGLNRMVNERLTVGGRAKLFSGLAHAQTTNNSVLINMNTNDQGRISYDGQGNFDVTSSGIRIYRDDPAKLIVGYTNFGFALDLGGRYKINERWEVSASILDLFGKIKWKDNVTNYVADSIRFEAPAINAEDLYWSKGKQALNDYSDFLDSLSFADSVTVNRNAYKTRTSTKLFLSGSMYITRRLQVAATSEIIFGKDKVRPYLQFSLIGRVKRFLNYMVSYSVINDNETFLNLGLGFAINMGPVQLFAMTNNIFDPWFVSEKNNPTYRFGLNLVIGRDHE